MSKPHMLLDRRLPMVALVVPGLAGALVAQGVTFRTGVETVAVSATVRDEAGRLVPDLPVTAFEILEDGRPVDLSVFSVEAQPLSVALMLDTSESMTGWGGPTNAIPTSVVAFLDALHPDDRASIGTFGLEIAVGANLTNDRAEHRRVLDEEIWKGGGSPVWEAIRAAMTSLEAEPGRRVVLALTDGADSGGLPGFDGGRAGAERQAIETTCMVYAVGFEAPGRDWLSGSLADLTEATGGGHVAVPRDGDLAGTMTRIAEELRHQYQLGFVPHAADGKVHALEVRMRQSGLHATARRRFVAPSRP